MNSGVYEIASQIDNRRYIGSSVDLRLRKNSHYCDLRLSRHANKHLQSFFNKYGEENLVFRVLGYVPIEHLLEVEQFCIDEAQPIFNNRKIAESNLGLPAWNKGGYSKEMADDLSERLGHKVVAYDLNGNFVKIFSSMRRAEIEIGIGGLISAIQGKSKSYGGYLWRRYTSDYPKVIERYHPLTPSRNKEASKIFHDLKQKK